MFPFDLCLSVFIRGSFFSRIEQPRNLEKPMKLWLNKEAFNERDPERLICDYSENDLRGW
jgi:hypothetical protein